MVLFLTSLVGWAAESSVRPPGAHQTGSLSYLSVLTEERAGGQVARLHGYKYRVPS